MTEDCVFCQIVAGVAPATVVTRTEYCTVIEPLNPVTPGHALVIPNRHVKDALEDPKLTGEVMETACHIAKHPDYYARPRESVNLITSVGAAATQSVWHLHVHIVPRRRGDGLLLPWGSNEQHMRRVERAAHAKERRDGLRVLQRMTRTEQLTWFHAVERMAGRRLKKWEERMLMALADDLGSGGRE